MKARARVAHHVPGRIRIRVHGGRQNAELLSHIEQSLLPVGGVARIETNPETGSVTIWYDARRPEQFYERLKQQGVSSGAFDLVPPDIGGAGQLRKGVSKETEVLAAHSELARTLVEHTRNLDNAVKRATDNNVDLKVLVPLGFAIYSAVQFGAEIATPLWLTLGMFSFHSFLALHPPLPYPKAENLPFSEEQHSRAPHDGAAGD